ncbi:MAG: murein hydrolase activator EnvC family protein [Bacteroidota bacterium]
MKFRTNIFIFLLFSFIITFTTPDLYCQRKEELKERIDNKRNEIENANKILKETEENRQSTLHQLTILKKRVTLRNELLEQLDQQVSNIEGRIANHQRQIGQFQDKIERLKKSYEKIIYNAYLNNKGFNKLMFILSAESFNQAYKRFKYLNQLAKYRRDQARQIKIQKEKLELKIQELRHLRSQKEDIRAEKLDEKQKLKHEENQVKQQVQSLKRKESQIRQDIQQKQQTVAQLEKEIEKIIEEERKRTKHWEDLSDKQKEITDAFANNKGKLEWPINDGVITSDFGENSHPVLKGIKTFNNGIDISATKNSKVQCIFDGVARKVISIPGANLTVIVRHGNYLTVYSNLVNVNVQPGDEISKGEIIGEVYQDKSTSENILHLELYRESERLNPKEWLNY